MSREFRRLLLVWICASLVLTPLVAIFLADVFWPGKQADSAAGQVTDYTVGFAIGTPVVLFVLLFTGYSLLRFRQRGPSDEEGPRVFGNPGAALAWILASVAIALGAVVFDVVRIVKPGGAGAGQGPTPLAALTPEDAGPPASEVPTLPVQVIGQQWQFTYRYPTRGGLETQELVLPVDRVVEFHVTSLDVVHSFWAYQLGVKADANPGVDNVAYTTPRKIGSFDVRCAELCGIWHGYMAAGGRVVSRSDFAKWLDEQQRFYASSKKFQTPYKETYNPTPRGRAN